MRSLHRMRAKPAQRRPMRSFSRNPSSRSDCGPWKPPVPGDSLPSPRGVASALSLAAQAKLWGGRHMASLRHIVLAAAVASFAAVAADPYPARPVRIVVATGAGTVDDVGARVVAGRMSELLGQQFYIENRPGAGGLIGQTAVLKSTPDGYTLLLAGGSMAGARYANAAATYDLLRDFTPISLIATSEFALVVNPALPVRDVKEFIALARSQPGKLTYGTIGAGQSPYWSVTLFNSMAGIQVMEIPYKATPEVIIDVVAGRVDYYITGLSSVLPVKDKLRILAVTTRTRAQTLPEVPTMAEALPGYEMPAWQSIMGPAK